MELDLIVSSQGSSSEVSEGVLNVFTFWLPPEFIAGDGETLTHLFLDFIVLDPLDAFQPPNPPPILETPTPVPVPTPIPHPQPEPTPTPLQPSPTPSPIAAPAPTPAPSPPVILVPDTVVYENGFDNGWSLGDASGEGSAVGFATCFTCVPGSSITDPGSVGGLAITASLGPAGAFSLVNEEDETSCANSKLTFIVAGDDPNGGTTLQVGATMASLSSLLNEQLEPTTFQLVELPISGGSQCSFSSISFFNTGAGDQPVLLQINSVVIFQPGPPKPHPQPHPMSTLLPPPEEAISPSPTPPLELQVEGPMAAPTSSSLGPEGADDSSFMPPSPSVDVCQVEIWAELAVCFLVVCILGLSSHQT